MFEGVPSHYRVSSIELVEVGFERTDTDYVGKGASELEYQISKVSVAAGTVVVGTEYDLKLFDGDENELASVTTKFLVTFGSTEDDVAKIEDAELGSFYRAAASVAHPHHRQMLISIVEPSDLPVFRLPLIFDAEEDAIVDPADDVSPVAVASPA